MKILKSGDLEGPELPREKILSIVRQATEIVIHKDETVTHWWLVSDYQDVIIAYFGNEESFKQWKLSKVN
jgi:hypothetical protein